MEELKEIKNRLAALNVCQNGFIKVDDVKSVITFIEGLMFKDEEKEIDERR